MQLLKMCKISHLNGSIITMKISEQQTTAQRTNQKLLATLGQHYKFHTNKNPTGNVCWLCLLTLCLLIIMNTSSVSGSLHPIAEQIND